MARLHIYASDKGGRTVSKFGKPKDNDKIVFHNQQASNTLTISIQGEPAAGTALCKGSQKIDSFTVSPADKQAFSICADYRGETFKCTATIAGSEPEDPIIIIEHTSFLNSYGTGMALAELGLGEKASALAHVRRARDLGFAASLMRAAPELGEIRNKL